MNQLIFLHMPKTAGTTLQDVIDRQFARDTIYNVRGSSIATVQASINRLRAAHLRCRRGPRCIKGHMPYGLAEQLSSRATYITMLRDPLERLVSDYFYTINKSSHRQHQWFHSENIGFADYVSRPDTYIRNLYTALLGADFDWNNLAHWPVVDASSLAVAKQRIDDDVLTCITEHFDASLILLRSRFGWRDIGYERLNVTPGDKTPLPRLPADALALARRDNALDIELYEYARRQFSKRFSRDPRNLLHLRDCTG